MQNSPHVGVLVLNWNGAADTIACLRSVFALDYPSFGVVVCDNASSDDSLDTIRQWAEHDAAVASIARVRAERSGGAPRRFDRVALYDRASAEAGGQDDDANVPVILIQTGNNLGFAGGNNVGLRYFLSRRDVDYVWLLNNDTVVAPSALRELVSCAEADPRGAAVGGTLLELSEPDRVQEMGGATVSQWHGMVSVVGNGLPATATRPSQPMLDYISGGCLLVRRDVVERIGLLDERFFLYGEDVDWGLRMRDAGYSLLYAPQAHVWHKGSGSVKRGSASRANHDYHNVRGALLLVHKRHPKRLPIAILWTAYRCALRRVVRLEWHRLNAIGRAYRDVLKQVWGGQAGSVESAASRTDSSDAYPDVSEVAS
jgi:GT2 family glycosyltransferase